MGSNRARGGRDELLLRKTEENKERKEKYTKKRRNIKKEKAQKKYGRKEKQYQELFFLIRTKLYRGAFW